ncbi:predicted protein [Plenodomus lingam JN3]|uniref:Predicted protein n=1 Tax=Leptosphaeria maculans (strain JN3 / isolate v23.1.3 / race Av1-4-5-6-7-8) TaxID=985895 RepID=E4ZSY7_LEPMJ|nr:predicted protein [Plenodomus lingam JN3]CBX94575.1 predicted protein [Plenodomus lingam JN3]
MAVDGHLVDKERRRLTSSTRDGGAVFRSVHHSKCMIALLNLFTVLVRSSKCREAPWTSTGGGRYPWWTATLGPSLQHSELHDFTAQARHTTQNPTRPAASGLLTLSDTPRLCPPSYHVQETRRPEKEGGCSSQAVRYGADALCELGFRHRSIPYSSYAVRQCLMPVWSTKPLPLQGLRPSMQPISGTSVTCAGLLICISPFQPATRPPSLESSTGDQVTVEKDASLANESQTAVLPAKRPGSWDKALSMCHQVRLPATSRYRWWLKFLYRYN